MQRRGAFCVTMPTWSIAATKGAALPSDQDVVDAEAAQSREQMLRGGAQRPGGISENSGEFGGGDGAHIRLDLPFGTIGGRGPQECDAAIRIGRMKRDGSGESGMNTDAEHGGVVA
jgi:hypothetical protein